MPLTDPQPPEATPDYLYTGSYDSSGNPYDSASGCAMDGQPLPCTLLLRLRATGRGLTSTSMESASGGTHVRVDEWDEYGLPGGDDVFEFDGQGVRYGGDAGNVVARNVGSYRFVQTGSVRTTITQQPQRPGRAPTQPTVPIQNLRENIEKMLKTGNCGKFVQELLDKAAKLFPRNSPRAKTILEAFDNISSQGGYVLTTGVGVHTVSGDYYVHKETGGAPWALSAMAHIIPWYNLSGRPPSARTIAMAQAYYALAALHETFHLAARGGFTDVQMAEAVAELTGAPGLPKPGSDNGAFSSYWDRALTKNCPEMKVR